MRYLVRTFNISVASDMTISSVHTSDLSSFEESAMSEGDLSSDEEAVPTTTADEQAEAETEREETQGKFKIIDLFVLWFALLYEQ